MGFMTTSLKIVGMIFTFLFSLHSFSAPRTGKYFDRALFVIFENTDYSKSIMMPLRTLSEIFGVK
jgi:hypothetical protein